MSETTEPSNLDVKVMWDRFQAIAEEMWDTASRLAFSISIREWNDTSMAVMTADGRSVGLSRRSVPVLSGALSRTTRIILDEYIPPEELEPGDIIITNDPWIGGGHLSDIVLLKPVFSDGELISFVGSLGHVGDVGGLMGGWNVDATQFYEEGLQIPPVKFYEAGEINETVESFIRGNVRIPDQVMGDVEALRSATTLGGNRVEDLVESHGKEHFKSTTEEVIERSEQAIRNKIREVDDGTYSHSLSFSVADNDITIDTTVTVSGDQIHVDYTGSSDQIEAGINCPFANTYAVTQYIIRCMLDPSTANAEGFFAPIDITAPEGSIVNCSRPLATDGRHLTYTQIEDCLVQALGQAIPEMAVTEAAGIQLINFQGTDENGDQFIGVNNTIGPFPARSNMDGMGAVYFPYNGRNVPIEIFEQYVPVRIVENRLVRDSEGAGKFRSGLANQITFKNLLDSEISLSYTSNKDDHDPKGFDGGHTGVASNVESSTEGKEVPTSGRVTMESGEELTFSAATSGGYGDPKQRDEEKIQRDIELGYISEERAEEVYGYNTSSE